MTASIAARFAAAMEVLVEPAWQGAPFLAVAVSGGADSTCLALLARDWAVARGGRIIALVVDHGLRHDSAAEAALTLRRLAAGGIASDLITLAVPPGSAVQERARTLRHAALARRAVAHGALWLLLGHHAADQAELGIMRAARGPGGAGGMAGFAARHDVILLRPLLGERPADLRQALRDRGVEWVEDPSNHDQRFERARIRAASPGCAPEPGTEPGRADERRAQAEAEAEAARFLARRAQFHPGGFATIATDEVPPVALAALIRVVGGAVYPPPLASVTRLATALQPATLGGVQIMRARAGTGRWLLCREVAACAPPVAATARAVWDQRFTIRSVPAGASVLGALGDAAPQFRRRSSLPGTVLRGMPAFFGPGGVIAVPHGDGGAQGWVAFTPPAPARPLRWMMDAQRNEPPRENRSQGGG